MNHLKHIIQTFDQNIYLSILQEIDIGVKFVSNNELDDIPQNFIEIKKI